MKKAASTPKLKTILTQGECLQEMTKIPDGYVDMVLCDLPYGTTQNKWDTCIDLTELWAAYRRVCKPNAAIVLTAAQPFTSVLVCSNLREYRHAWVWDKVGTTGFQTAKVQPLRRHEDVLVFGRKKSVYNPAMEQRGKPRKKGGSKTDNGCFGELRSAESFNDTYYPTTILQVSNASKKGLVHPTQKPVALMEYLIKTYTDEGMTVLDNCMGSGTTGVACVNLKRSFIGIEQDPAYFKIARERIQAAQKL